MINHRLGIILKIIIRSNKLPIWIINWWFVFIVIFLVSYRIRYNQTNVRACSNSTLCKILCNFCLNVKEISKQANRLSRCDNILAETKWTTATKIIFRRKINFSIFIDLTKGNCFNRTSSIYVQSIIRYFSLPIILAF